MDLKIFIFKIFLKKNKIIKCKGKSMFSIKGFSILEVVFSVAILSVIGVFSINELKNHNKKLLKKEAKILLSLYYKNQTRFFFEHKVYSDKVSDILQPEGQQIYNIGVKNLTTFNLCGTDYNSKRIQCAFNCEPGKNASFYDPVNGIGGSIDSRHSFEAVAVADLWDVEGCSTTSSNRLDVWKINARGELDNTNDALE